MKLRQMGAPLLGACEVFIPRSPYAEVHVKVLLLKRFLLLVQHVIKKQCHTSGFTTQLNGAMTQLRTLMSPLN